MPRNEFSGVKIALAGVTLTGIGAAILVSGLANSGVAPELLTNATAIVNATASAASESLGGASLTVGLGAALVVAGGFIVAVPLLNACIGACAWGVRRLRGNQVHLEAPVVAVPVRGRVEMAEQPAPPVRNDGSVVIHVAEDVPVPPLMIDADAPRPRRLSPLINPTVPAVESDSFRFCRWT